MNDLDTSSNIELHALADVFTKQGLQEFAWSRELPARADHFKRKGQALGKVAAALRAYADGYTEDAA